MRLLNELLDWFDEQQDEAVRDHDRDVPEEEDLLLRELERIANNLNAIHNLLATYRVDLTARLPVGLTHLVFATVDEIVQKPHGLETDPLIHLDADNMYSVYDLLEDVSPLFGLADNDEPDNEEADNDGRPLILNLPGLDPANAFLAPILAHEVAHIASDSALLDALDDRLDWTAIRSGISEASGHQTGRDGLERRLQSWLEEELCDAVACVVTGPAFLYAEAAFLPAGKRGRFSDHPYPAQRIRWALWFLDRLGWTAWMRKKTPECLTFFEEVAKQVPDSTSAAEVFLENCVQDCLGDVLRVAQTDITALEPREFRRQNSEFELCRSIKRGFMPSKLGAGRAPGLWHLLLAGWVSYIDLHGGQPRSLTKAIGDEEFNRFLVKALELTGLAQLWEADDDPA